MKAQSGPAGVIVVGLVWLSWQQCNQGLQVCVKNDWKSEDLTAYSRFRLFLNIVISIFEETIKTNVSLDDHPGIGPDYSEGMNLIPICLVLGL